MGLSLPSSTTETLATPLIKSRLSSFFPKHIAMLVIKCYFLKLENYTFCEGSAVPSICKKNDIGMYVDVAIVVKSRGDKKASKRGDGGEGKIRIRCLKKDNYSCPDVYGFGDEAEMALTKTVTGHNITIEN